MYSFDTSISVIHIIWWSVNVLALVLIFWGSRKNIKYIDHKKKINGKEYLRDTGPQYLTFPPASISNSRFINHSTQKKENKDLIVSFSIM